MGTWPWLTSRHPWADQASPLLPEEEKLCWLLCMVAGRMRTSVRAALTESLNPVTGCRGAPKVLESGSHRDRCSFPASPLLSHLSPLPRCPGGGMTQWRSGPRYRKHTTGNYFKGIEKGDIFHYGLVCLHNIPLFLATHSALLPHHHSPPPTASWLHLY